MRRRTVLAALATGTAALAGCTEQVIGDGEDDSPETPDDPQTPAPNGDDEKTPDSKPETDVSLSVERTTVLPEVVALDSPDSIGTFGGRSSQFLVGRITTEDKKLTRQDLQLSAGDASYQPVTTIGNHQRALWQSGEFYFESDDTDGVVAFKLPKPLSGADSDGVTLSWPGGSQALGKHVRTHLARKPTSFAVSVEASAEASVDSPAELSVTVENTGDVPGTFVGALNRIGPLIAYAPIESIVLDIPAGEQETWDHTFTLDRDKVEEGRDSFEFRVKWRNGSETRTVDIVE
jgi:hypothetical protein